MRARPTVTLETSSWDLGLILLAEAALLVLVSAGPPVGFPHALRAILGLVTTLFIPGYLLSTVLLPRPKDLAGAERLAASFGLSLAVIPPIALVLDHLPWGLRPWPMVISLALFAIVCVIGAGYRRRAIARESPAERSPHGGGTQLWSRQRKRSGLALATISILVIALVATALATVIASGSSGSATEFYLLGPDGLAEGYPRETLVNQPVVVTVGVANHDASPVVFRVEVTEDGRVIGGSPPIHVDSGQVRQFPLSITPTNPSEDDPVTISLYREGESIAYRTLLLWLNVGIAGPPTGSGSLVGSSQP